MEAFSRVALRISSFVSRCKTDRRLFQGQARNMQYDEAVRTLNVMQTNGNRPKFRDASCLVAMQELLNRVNISQQDLKNLNIIHISGTKGKGSTCAFIESILRHHGYKTGFFSSPHLIEVRERFRINGKPISQKEFADYFQEVYDKFTDTIEGSSHDYPSYFYFLTTMAFYIFSHKCVDVAIMEVGIGGSFDCTNVAQNPVVCGVSSLGYDHVALLGRTIESIAWHKAGIFKPGICAFTVPQKNAALQVMAQTAFDNETRLAISPDLSTYKLPSGRTLKLGLDGEHQKVNASLALQIANVWMRKKRLGTEKEFVDYRSEVEAFPSYIAPFPLTDAHLKALENCTWKGRAQIVKFDKLSFYLDGAHTVQSMRCCASWFQEAAAEEERVLGRQCARILVFNITGQRDPAALFAELQDCRICYAVFTPNIATFVADKADQTNFKSTIRDQLLTTVRNYDEWLHQKSMKKGLGCNNAELSLLFPNGTPTDAPIFPTIANAVTWLSKGRDSKLFLASSKLSFEDGADIPQLNDVTHIQVLVAGSVHLVGGFLRILQPPRD